MRKYNNVSFRGTFHLLSTPSPQQRWLWSLPSDFCQCPMNNEIRKVHLLSIPSKNLSERSKFCRLIGRKNLGSPYMKTCHPWGEGVRIKTRTSHCLISPKGTLYFTFDHQVFLRSTKLCPTPPAASPHNSWATLRLHKSNLMISPANTNQVDNKGWPGLSLTWATVKLHTFYFIIMSICTQILHVCVKVRSPSYIITYRSRRAFKNSDITILEHVKQCRHETFLDIIWRERKREKYHRIFCCWFTSRQSVWCSLFQIIIYNSFFPLFIVL